MKNISKLNWFYILIIYMKQSEIYGYNFPLNWGNGEELLDRIKSGIKREVEYEIMVEEPFENDIEMLGKSDNMSDHKVWEYIIR